MTPPPSPRILLIEDDPAIGRSLVEALTEEGFQVTWRTAGREGLAAARQEAPQLIILGVRLPDGPIKATNSPLSMASDTSTSAGISTPPSR